MDAASILYGYMDQGKTAPDAPTPTNPPAERSQAERIYGDSPKQQHEDVFEKAFRKEQPKAEGKPTAQTKPTQHDTQVAQDIGQAMEGLLKEQGLVADQHSDALAEFLKTNNLGVDQAKALTELHRARVQEQEDQQFAAWHEQSLKEFANVDLQPARNLLYEHADPDLIELLESTGAGSHPAVIRFLKRLADAW